MRDRLVALAGVVLFASLVLVEAARPQQSGATKDQKAAPVVLLDGWGRPVEIAGGQKSAPAPRHDISGIWEPANGPGDGIHAFWREGYAI